MPMDDSIDVLLKQRDSILDQMRDLDGLRRGSLSRQFFKSPGQPHVPGRGPYYVLQGFVNGRKFSERVPADKAAQVQAEVDNYRRFQSLAEEYVTVCDQITRLQTQLPDRKKNSSRRKSPRRALRKPQPS